MSRCIAGYSNVLPLNIASSESFTRHELTALLAAHFVDDQIKRALCRVETSMYSVTMHSPKADDGDIQAYCIDCFLYGWLIDR
jgi:hypothetical protein